jgi:hypothetical protein
MLVMKVNKDLSTKECIEYGKQLSEHLGEKVVVLDNKVKEFYRLDEPSYFIPEPLIPFTTTPNDYWYWTTCTSDTTTSTK